MSDGPNIAKIAALIGDPARAEMLAALLGGQALTATELAQIADITKQTVSAHLAKLVDAKLVAVASQGRHRYFRLADDDVANLLETLMGVAHRAGAVRLRSSPREPALRKARVCYDHLAGELGVLTFESLQQKKFLHVVEQQLMLTPKGETFFRDLKIDIDNLNPTLNRARRPLCRTCLDWSVRRNHLAGALGAALLQRIYKLGWARRVAKSRIVRFTPHGEHSLKKLLGA